MKHKTIITTIAGVVAVVGIAGGAALAATGDSEGSVSGPQADQAVAAALVETGGGHANAVERDSENGATWEVEVAKPDGATVDVRLDERYHVVVVEPDNEAPGESTNGN